MSVKRKVTISFLNNFLILKDFFLTKSSLRIIYLFYSSKIKKRKKIRKYKKQKIQFQNSIKTLHHDSDWFSHNIPFWMSYFDELSINKDSKINYLEIGSWEGLSAFFVLNYFKNAQITCVDTWCGGEEHQNKYNFNKIETNFDYNTKFFKERLTKFKGTSYKFFEENNLLNIFDFIYIDGSHYCDDVLIDALKSFQLLKVGGIIIFDDFIGWDNGDHPKLRPLGALDAFLKLKKNSYKIIEVSHQLTLQKIM